MKKELKNKIDYRLEAIPNATDDTCVVYLYGDIVDERPRDWWSGELIEGDYITPGEVRNLIDGIKENKIELHINSYGGSVFASIAIFNYLNTLNKEIITYNDGICASGASIILMAGKESNAYKNAMIMIHRASTFCWGNCNELKEQAEILEKLDNSTVLETYKKKFKGTDEELMDLIDSETWISASEAKEYGFIDNLIELSEDTNEEKSADVKDKEIEEILNRGAKFMQNFANLKFKGENK